MKFLIALLISIMFVGQANAATFYAWRYREHATDCTALTDGKNTDLCYEMDSDRFFANDFSLPCSCTLRCATSRGDISRFM